MVSVYTIGDRCKKCYSCVRSCPTKAIKVQNGQAEIMEELCISCGRCVIACSQNAKVVRSSINQVVEILNDKTREKYALVAPSFPAAFLDVNPNVVVTALRRAGFDKVFEVAYGADLVSYEYYKRYRTIGKKNANSFIITSPCPAVVFYVEKIFPDLIPYLANIVSPMEAMARCVKEKVNEDAHFVFIGPCVAKKDEIKTSKAVEEVLTFYELEELLKLRGVDFKSLDPEDFDPPNANLGRIYPVTGGLLKAAFIDDDLLESPVMIVEGPERTGEILSILSRRVKNGEKVGYRFFDILFCEGCIGGPFMMNDLTFYERKRYIVEYMKSKPMIMDIGEWEKKNKEFLDVDLSRSFTPYKKELKYPTEEEIKKILAMTNKFKPEDELNCGACGYSTCREKAIAVYMGKAEVEMCLPYLISRIEETVKNLKENQARLIQAEKLASMGQMAAGIAHEINNPLGIVLMFSHILKEELEDNPEVVKDIDRIIEEAERTRKIVRGILNFARQEKVDRKPTDINELIIQSVEGIIGDDKGRKYRVELDLDKNIGIQMVDESQIRQVFDNIIKNACEAMESGGTLRIKSEKTNDGFCVKISDTGPGIPEEHLSKLFSPFFTTKPVGKGTGLGLPVCYGIVKMHGGNIEAGNNPDGGAYFKVYIKSYTNE